MLLTLLVLAGAGLLAAYVYVTYRFDDPSVPVAIDLFPPDTRAPFTLLEIWSHPDDETTVGGTTVRYGRDPQVGVVACYFTCGEAGKPGVPPICKQEELALVRRGEMAVAATLARMTTHEVADYGDGRLADRAFDALEAQAVRWIRTYRPTVIITWDASGSSGHPDHIRTHEVVHAAFDSAADPQRFPEQMTEDGLQPHQALRLFETVVPARLAELYRAQAFRGNTWAMDHRATPTHALDVRSTASDRARIVQAHRTQLSGLKPFSAWYGGFVYRCWQKEYFRLARTAEPPASR